MNTCTNLVFYLTFYILFYTVRNGTSLTLVEKQCKTTSIDSTTWTKESFPNPQTNVDRCGRHCKKSFVCDPFHVLSEKEGDDLDELLETVESSAECNCSTCTEKGRVYIGVAIVTSMGTVKGQTTTSSIEETAQYLRTRWNTKSACGNDVLLLVSTTDKRIYTSVGNFTGRVLTTECIETVNDQVEDLINDGEYYSAMKSIINNYKFILSKSNCDYFTWKRKLSLISFILGGVFGCMVFVVAITTVIRTHIGSKRHTDEKASEGVTNTSKTQQLHRNRSYDGENDDKYKV